jgi:cobalt-zinc-cadmium resistance protein CzcA
MRFTDIPANLLSLGAIDFGIIVDAAIVVLENVLSMREHRPDAELTESDVRGAAIAVAKPIFYSKLIIIAAYLPLFAFERVEKKLFTPMAYTVAYALIGATLLALALIPGLALAAYRKPRKMFHNRPLEAMNRGYVHALERILRAPYRLAIVPGIVAALAAIVLGVVVGKEFLPELDEGSLWLQVQLPPGLSLEKASDMASEVRAAALEFPQVKYIVTQLGRNDDGTDPWTPSHIESSVGLTPYASWPEGMVKRDLVAKLSARFAKLPGISVGFSQPMIDGVNDKVSGAHSEIVIKVFGDDLAQIRRSAEAIKQTIMGIPGAVDVAIDQEPPLPQIQITVNREAAARFGINVGALAELIEVGIGGRPVGQLFLGERRYEIAVRFDPKSRDTPEDIGNLTLPTQDGARIPLSQLSQIQLTSGESTITREVNRRHLTIKVNLRGRDFSSFFAEANPKIVQQMQDQTELEVKWGGQFENQNRAQGRLAIVIPAVLGVIFLILFGVFGNARHPALILSNVPLAALGGMAALVLRGMTLNVSSAVGFIALFGISMQNGVIMVSNLNVLRDSGLSLTEAVAKGAGERFRPVLMTALVAALGLVPAALARGIGSDVQRPLATVIVGGLITATVLALYVLPAIYLVVERRYLNKRTRGEEL